VFLPRRLRALATHRSQIIISSTSNQSNGAGMTSEKSSESTKVLDFLMIFKTKLFLMFVIVFAISLILLGFPNLAPGLMASSRNVLSAFTSVFVHKDLAHLGASLILTLTVLLLYSLSNTIAGKSSGNFIILAIWISTISASLAFVNLAPNARVGGSSGLVSAFLSGAVVTAYLNAYEDPVRHNRVFQLIIGTILVVAFVILNLNVDAETNVTIHLSSFLYMAVLMLGKRFLSSFFSKKD